MFNVVDMSLRTCDSRKPVEQSMIEEEVNTLKKMFRAHTKEEFHPHITSGKVCTCLFNILHKLACLSLGQSIPITCSI